MKQSIEFDAKIPSASNMREHWAVKAKRVKAQRAAVSWRLLHMPRPYLPCGIRVGLTRIAARKLDDDNLRGALKAHRDAVAQWLGVDDADPRVEWSYAQEKGAPKRQALRITIEELPS